MDLYFIPEKQDAIDKVIFENIKESNEQLNFEEGGLHNLPKCNLSECYLFKDTYQDFYARDAKRIGMKIEDYMIKQLQICGQYIECELNFLLKYNDNIMKDIDIFNGLDKKSYEYECIVLTIKELYDRVTHQFEEYYELNDTYKLYKYKGHYKSIVYVYEKLIMSHKKQFDDCVETINYFIVNLY